MKAIKRIISLFVVALMLCTLFGMTAAIADGESNKDGEAISELSQLDGKTVGCLVGSSFIPSLREQFPNMEIVEYPTNADLISALKSGRLDSYVADEPMALAQLRETEGIKSLEGLITHDEFAFILNHSSKELGDRINALIEEYKSEGILAELREKWVIKADNPKLELPETWDKSNGTLTVGLSLDSVPFAYMQDGQVVGYDVELLYMIAQRLGYGLKIVSSDFMALLDGISADKYDIAIGCITKTPERAESVLFTQCTYDGGTVAIVLGEEETKGGFFEELAASFERTFIRENRWRLVLDGLIATLELSVLTLFLGSLAGFGFSFMLRSKNTAVRRLSQAFSGLLDGLPLLIILMLFYYVVFAKTALPAIIIGVIGLSLDFAATVAGIINTGVGAVDAGQIEAAEAMGYSKGKCFRKIVFPQAANYMFSQYTGAIIGMVKGTSIVGYITVFDLTKAGDVIRALTYEAFFPLISIALIYFILIQILLTVMKLAAKSLEPKRRKRAVKGVIIHD